MEEKKKALTKRGDAPPQLGAELFPVSYCQAEVGGVEIKDSTLFRFGTQLKQRQDG